MKKTVPLLALLLCLCLLSACTIRASDGASPTDAPASAGNGETADQAPVPEPVSAADLLPPKEPEEAETEPPIPETETDTPDFTGLEAYECIEDVGAEPGHLARITLDCDGASDINAEILRDLRPLAEDEVCDVRYECHKSGRVLSLLYIRQFEGDCTYYTPFNLDLVTGERLTGADLLALIGVSADDLAAEELSLMGSEFENLFGNLKEQAGAFYDEQYERTVSPDNADTERLWIDDFGRLYFAARIYSMAGADYYEYPMITNYSLS